MDSLLPSGSVIHILSLRDVAWREDRLSRYFKIRDLDGYNRIALHHYVGASNVKMDVLCLPLERADCALILAEQGRDEAPLSSDSKNLAAAITLRSCLSMISERKASPARPKCKIVTELLDTKSEQFLTSNNNVRRQGSFIYSNALETAVFAMAVDNSDCYRLFMQLCNPNSGAGHVIASPISDWVKGTELLSFQDLQKRVFHARNAVLLGWRRTTDRYANLNPLDKDTVMEWKEGTGDELLIFQRDTVLGSVKQEISGFQLEQRYPITSIASDGESQLPAAVQEKEMGLPGTVEETTPAPDVLMESIQVESASETTLPADDVEGGANQISG
eukprot:TRINITY_DN54189_c0_g1_i1.p1 TRINITY_DN54189_c0_g1~~TRINITY_DN54189_c0_g1_i1.p1  ORF type:complete len:341 (-),score=46.30 TRINITY_DN54189_c0_g1_i1:70-1065(-)